MKTNLMSFFPALIWLTVIYITSKYLKCLNTKIKQETQIVFNVKDVCLSMHLSQGSIPRVTTHWAKMYLFWKNTNVYKYHCLHLGTLSVAFPCRHSSLDLLLQVPTKLWDSWRFAMYQFYSLSSITCLRQLRSTWARWINTIIMIIYQ